MRSTVSALKARAAAVARAALSACGGHGGPRLLVAVAALGASAVLAGSTGCGPAPQGAGGGGGGGSKVLGVSLLNQTNDFFKEMEAGMREEAGKHGYALLVQSADQDATTQARQIEDFVTRKVDAIVLNPCDSDTVSTHLRTAREAGIPVFTADIAAKGADVVSHVASDNVQGGRLAGEALAKHLGGKGTVIVIDHPTVSSVQDRVKGFEEALRAHPGIRVVGKPSSEGQREKAQAVTEDALTAHPDLAGIFAINDNSALGALRAAESRGRKDLVIVGYDAIPEACDAIRRGSPLKASVVQHPRAIGAKSIEAAVTHLAGGPVPKVTPVAVGTEDAASLAAKK